MRVATIHLPRFIRSWRSWFLGAGLLLCAGPTIACTLSTQPLGFGNINPIAGTSTNSTSSITVTCPSSTSIEVWISSGSGTVSQRTMSSGANQLHYNVYTDAALTTIWGDGAEGTSWTTTADSAGTTATVYGHVPNQPAAYPGTYSDSLIVTVSF